jgi:D-glycero-D-manno-heptose 1,7-bisphosphate phosphatase
LVSADGSFGAKSIANYTNTTKAPAIFLDRDGVLNVVDKGYYVRNRDEMVWLPGAAEAVGRLTQADWRIIVITNQSGIGRGFYTRQDVEAIHAAMEEAILKYGGRFEALYVCPHTDMDGCDCRKPMPGMLRCAAEDLGVDLPGSYFVGDSETDTLAGRAAGCRAIAVASGMSTREEIARWAIAPDGVYASLAEATDAILAGAV